MGNLSQTCIGLFYNALSFSAAQNTADWNAPKAKDGWPAWPLLSQRKPLASQSISATSDARLKPPEGQEKSELAWTKLGVEWNGCY